MSVTLLHLDPGLPPRVPPHRDLVWGFSGWARRQGARLRTAMVVIGPARFPAEGLNTVRFDAEAVQRRHGVRPDLACGFWGLATLPAAGAGETQRPVLVLEWTDGTREEWPAEPVAVEASTPTPTVASAGMGTAEDEPSERGTLVAIAMATYNPDPVLFRAQVDSIRSQTHGHWVCLIEDDGSDDAHWRDILEATSGDDRFRPVRNSVNLGFYRNFERALGRVPVEAEFVALADQDDRWAPGRVAALVAALTDGSQDGRRGGAVLAFGNMRVVDDTGQVVSETFWPGLDSRHDSLDALLMANAVTGCACLFRASLLRLALPFPALGRLAFHDHWIACCAAAEGTIVYLPQSLGDYVQHGANSLGYRRRPGLRLAAKLAAALAAAPALALAAQSAAARRRLAGPLHLLVGVPDAELVCRAAFAETLRRRGGSKDGPEGGGPWTAVDTFLPGPHPGRRLLTALLRRGPRGRAFRGVAARLFAGLTIGRLVGLLARLRAPSGAVR
ncbi:glycosyltransferase [Azospirillum argentinense]